MFENCEECQKPKVNEANLKTLRKLVAGCTIGGGLLFAPILPLLGFGLGGTAGSFVAVLLQSLEATGLGILLFGSIGSALGLLSSVAAKLNWCTCQQ